MNDKFWLYIEPYVEIIVHKNSTLLYNTLNGKHLEYQDSPEIISLVKNILTPKNNRIISITNTDYTGKIICDFVKDLQQIHAGDIINKNLTLKKPFQFTPIINLQSDVKRFKKEREWIGNDILNNLFELTIFVNSKLADSPYQNEKAFKQIMFPYSGIEYQELSFNSILAISKSLSTSSPCTIKISGGNLCAHTEINNIILLFNSVKRKVKYIFNSSEFIENLEILNKINPTNSSITVNTFIRGTEEEFLEKIFTIRDYPIPVTFSSIIEDDSDMEKIASSIPDDYPNPHFLAPYYNGTNIAFFKSNVFTKIEEIFIEKQSQFKIQQKKKINTNLFGKLHILPNKDVYSGVNEKSIGNIGTSSLKELIYFEMARGKSWLKTRTSVIPCKYCNYQFLCPSISNYEYALGQFDLCNIQEHNMREKTHTHNN
ncbi:MAG: TIGR04150 pseudo-rSAM protein [Bacteroidota bacterium]